MTRMETAAPGPAKTSPAVASDVRISRRGVPDSNNLLLHTLGKIE